MDQIIVLILVAVVGVLLLKRPSMKKAGTISSKDSMPYIPPQMQDDIAGPAYDYQNFLYSNGLDAERFDSHKQFVRDTYTDGLLLGSSKDIVRDDVNDINPYLGLRRPNYDVVIGSGARQVPTDYRDQLADVRAPSFA